MTLCEAGWALPATQSLGTAKPFHALQVSTGHRRSWLQRSFSCRRSAVHAGESRLSKGRLGSSRRGMPGTASPLQRPQRRIPPWLYPHPIRGFSCKEVAFAAPDVPQVELAATAPSFRRFAGPYRMRSFSTGQKRHARHW